jgi:outer membrane protein
MKKTVISLLSTALLAAFSLQAQKVWTLKECIDYALANNIAIKTAGLNAEVQEIEKKNTQFRRLPYVSASASHNIGFGQTQDNTGVYVNSNSQSTSAGLSTGITLFNGFQINNSVKAQQYSTLASLENLNKANNSIKAILSQFKIFSSCQALWQNAQATLQSNFAQPSSSSQTA